MYHSLLFVRKSKIYKKINSRGIFVREEYKSVSLQRKYNEKKYVAFALHLSYDNVDRKHRRNC